MKSLGHSTSQRTMHTAIQYRANSPLFSFEAFTTGSGEASMAVCSFTRGQLSDNGANTFVKHTATGHRHLQQFGKSSYSSIAALSSSCP